MRVLFLSPRQAWPPTSGARLRDFHFAQALGRRFELSYLFFGGEPAAEEFKRHLHAKSIHAVLAPPKYTAAKILSGLVGSTPLPVLNYAGPEMLAAIRNSLTEEPFDVVHLESLHLASYLPAIQQLAPEAITVLNWHNIESELMLRFAANSGSASKSAYARFTAGKLARLELALLGRCFGHLACSKREKDLLLGLNPDARVVVMENGVDTDRFRPGSNPEWTTLVFVGQMSYHANIEAAVWFVREIWPAVRSSFPRFTLSIVGSDPAPAVLALARVGEIQVTGTVADILPFYQNAFAAIVPLQTGGGTRLKILEAMAAGTPVISTAAGAEGLEVSHGSTIQIAENCAESWISALRVLENAETRQRMTQQARELVCARYDWAIIGNRLADTYEDWVNQAR